MTGIMWKLWCSESSPPLGSLLTLKAIGKLDESTGQVESVANKDTEMAVDGIKLSTDTSIARALARLTGSETLLGSPNSAVFQEAQVESWLSFSEGILNGNSSNGEFIKGVEHIEGHLKSAKHQFLTGSGLTVADLCLAAKLIQHPSWDESITTNFPSTDKFMKVIQNDVRFKETIEKAIKNKKEQPKVSKKTNEVAGKKSTLPKEEGKYSELPGAQNGKVVVRFPPEASGYLHIGHAKAALLNQHYRELFNGSMIMRFDDTNPDKESSEYEQVILEDLEYLQFVPNKRTHTSDWFEQILAYCEQLLKEGKAFVDDCDKETMQKMRETRENAPRRDQGVDENLRMWNEMKKGSPEGVKCAVRVKMDMASNNGCLRDPVIYRCKQVPHVRLGDKYKVYPTYDFACPIVDSVEGVTHALRTTEYHDRDEQYYNILDQLGLRKPYIYEFSRLNMNYTTMSKRNLTKLVDGGHVYGWDDPRFPTVRGLRRRGLTLQALKEFILAQGSSKSVNNMEWDKIWVFNKKVIDPVAPRYVALSKDNMVPVHIKSAEPNTSKDMPLHPKDPNGSKKKVWFGQKLLIEQMDAKEIMSGTSVVFMQYGILKITKKDVDSHSGLVSSFEATFDPQNQSGFNELMKVTWVADVQENKETLVPVICSHFDHLINKAVISKDEDWQQYINYDSQHNFEMVGEHSMRNIKKGDVIQILRKGFYICDQAYEPVSVFSGQPMPLVLFDVPDGHTKSNPTSAKVSSNVGKSKELNLPKTSIVTTSSNADQILIDIRNIGENIRQLKSQKAAKEVIEPVVKNLLELKTKFKEVSGKDWNPNLVEAIQHKTPKPVVEDSKVTSSADNILIQIRDIGDTIRKLKTEKAGKDLIEKEVKSLLSLKTEFKEVSGKDWNPKLIDQIQETPKPVVAEAKSVVGKIGDDSSSGDSILIRIRDIGDNIRKLKAEKATKDLIEKEVKSLLSLKTQFKEVTGKDWNPKLVEQIFKVSSDLSFASPCMVDWTRFAGNHSTAHQQSFPSTAHCDVQSTMQGEAKERSEETLNMINPCKNDPIQEVKEFTPEKASPSAPADTSDNILIKIRDIGDQIRKLKAEKAQKETIENAVKSLISLKTEFKQISGKDWNPKLVEQIKMNNQPAETKSVSLSDSEIIVLSIKETGDKIRELKGKKADKPTIEAEVAKLLALKADYKTKSGQDWNQNLIKDVEKKTAEAPPPTPPGVSDSQNILLEIGAQGDKIRDLKGKKADKATIQPEVDLLLSLKTKFKEISGKDWSPELIKSVGSGNTPLQINNESPSKPKTQPPPHKNRSIDKKKENTPQKEEKHDSGAKKQTKLGIDAKKCENFAEWYSQVITKGELLEYYDVSGCYVLRPASYFIWEQIQTFFDKEIKKMGISNCYFPMFVSAAALEKEKKHVADFAPEVAWVTKSGDSDMAEPIAIRPTSETVMYPTYARWVQSHRDLPIKLNQWCNVVRWEFKHPTPFLRTREFLWQEGHTAFSSAKEAEEEVFEILDLYARVYTDLLAVPVIKGRKTEKEKFAGGDFTTTVECYIPTNGRGVQGATSHHLGQNFSKMFEIVYEDPQDPTKKCFAWQNSWGITTRTIGVAVMVHGDDKGLVIPPPVAKIQVVIVPCGITASMNDAERKNVYVVCEQLEKELAESEIRVQSDMREIYSPGWKFNHWELKGVPIRMEVGPKDISSKKVVLVRRDNNEKLVFQQNDIVSKVKGTLSHIYQSLYNTAKKSFDEHVKLMSKWDDVMPALDNKCFILAPFCGQDECEENIKKDSTREDSLDAGTSAMGAKSLCIPFDQPRSIGEGDACIHPQCKAKPIFFTLFGRSY